MFSEMSRCHFTAIYSRVDQSITEVAFFEKKCGLGSLRDFSFGLLSLIHVTEVCCYCSGYRFFSFNYAKNYAVSFIKFANLM
jgi:hypothetical protein